VPKDSLGGLGHRGSLGTWSWEGLSEDFRGYSHGDGDSASTGKVHQVRCPISPDLLVEAEHRPLMEPLRFARLRKRRPSPLRTFVTMRASAS
jgi:hypothetical protein